MIILPVLVITAPDGKIFVTQWNENTVDHSFRLQSMRYSGIDGVDVIPHGSSGANHSFIHIFAGSNSIAEAKAFEKALIKTHDSYDNGLDNQQTQRERGRWRIVHPTEGVIDNLLPVSCSRKISPVKSGDIDEVTVEWIEVLPNRVVSAPYNIDKINQLLAKIRNAFQWADTTISELQQAKTVMKSIMAVVKTSLSYANQAVQGIFDSINEIANMPAATLSDVIIGIQNLAMNISFGTLGTVNSATSIAKVAVSFINGFKNYNWNALGDRYTALFNDITLNSLRSAQAQTITKGEYRNRSEAVAAYQTYLSTSRTINSFLAEQESIFSNNLINNQYCANNDWAAEVDALDTSVKLFILQAVWNLDVLVQQTLMQDTPTLAFVINQYGSTSASIDSDYQYFININQLRGGEVMILPKGKMVQL
jgi:prophage DNA circulation protein